MTEDHLTELRNKIFRACEGHDADESIRAMASALSTFIIGCTEDRDARSRRSTAPPVAS
jgi:hypothetical protein